jgi:predicted nucleotidyltransferase
VTPEPLRLRELLARLLEAEVRFVLVGGLAVNAWGYLRATRDIDLVPEPSAENLGALDEVLRELGGKGTGDRTLVATDLGQVDVLQGLPQIPSFAVLDAAATDVDLDGLTIRVCSLDHLLAMKRASDRPRDRDDLEALEATQGDA